MSTVVDFHTHILPAVDDGSRSVEDSIEMLNTQVGQNVRRVVATPHFYPDRHSPERFLAKRQYAEIRLREAMRELPHMPELSVGAEVFFFDGVSDCEFLHEMAISNTNCVMIEMPMGKWSNRNLQELAENRYKQGLTPIIAHIDRYIRPFRTNRIPETLAELPVIVQANSSFFIDKFTRRLALKLLKEEKIQLIGSDCHNLDTRPPNISQAIKIIEESLGKDAVLKVNVLEDKVFSN